jgi:poly(hydroxyalkanoate) depolymerase family esterase
MKTTVGIGALAALAISSAVAFCSVLFGAGCAAPPDHVEAQRAALESVSSFGANPGNLTMYRYVPTGVGPSAPLVVALHACSMTAADYVGAGWNQLADAHHFYVLYPEQKTANNTLQCFNWSWDPSTPSGLQRGQGENESIKEMVDKMKADFSIDPARVYVTGFSAGAAEAIDLLALWPDVFAAGAPVAGIAYGCAATLSDTSQCLSPGTSKTAMQWGDLVRQADPGWTGAYPTVAVWQGASDSVVAPANLGELVKQWTNVLGVDATADETDTSGALTHQQFRDLAGVARVDTFEVAGLGHQIPVDPKNGCGTAGTFFADVGVCSTLKIAEVWGLVGSSTDGGTPGGGPDGGSVDDAGSLDDAGSSSTDDGAAGGSDAAPGDPTPGVGGGGSDPNAPSSGCAVAPGRNASPLQWSLLALLLVAYRLGRRRAAR